VILKYTATFQVLLNIIFKYSFSILCLEHHYYGDQEWRSFTKKLNTPGAFVYFWWSWSCYFGLGLAVKNFVLFTSLTVIIIIGASSRITT